MPRRKRSAVCVCQPQGRAARDSGSFRMYPGCLGASLSWLTNDGPLLPVRCLPALIKGEGFGRHAVSHHDRHGIIVMLESCSGCK